MPENVSVSLNISLPLQDCRLDSVISAFQSALPPILGELLHAALLHFAEERMARGLIVCPHCGCTRMRWMTRRSGATARLLTVHGHVRVSQLQVVCAGLRRQTASRPRAARARPARPRVPGDRRLDVVAPRRPSGRQGAGAGVRRVGVHRHAPPVRAALGGGHPAAGQRRGGGRGGGGRGMPPHPGRRAARMQARLPIQRVAAAPGDAVTASLRARAGAAGTGASRQAWRPSAPSGGCGDHRRRRVHRPGAL